MKMEVDRYVNLFQSVKARVGSDEVAAVILDQIGKDGRVRVMNGGSAGSSASNEATRVIHGDEPSIPPHASSRGFTTALMVLPSTLVRRLISCARRISRTEDTI